MSLLKLIAVGALGVVAYRAWQQHQANHRPIPADDGSRTAPHGDPVLVGEQLEMQEQTRRPAAHASRGFGEA